MSTIDDMLRIAREVQPDPWKRTEQVARIIDPAAFEDSTSDGDRASRKIHNARLMVMQANAVKKAHDVLTFLGVNTEADWFEILTRLAAEGRSDERA